MATSKSNKQQSKPGQQMQDVISAKPCIDQLGQEREDLVDLSLHGPIVIPTNYYEAIKEIARVEEERLDYMLIRMLRSGLEHELKLRLAESRRLGKAYSEHLQRKYGIHVTLAKEG